MTFLLKAASETYESLAKRLAPETQRPAPALKGFGWLVLGLGGLCVLFYSINEGIAAAVRDEAAAKAFAWPIFLGVLIFLMHLTYLRLVIGLLVLDEPATMWRWEKWLLPLLLLVAYACAAGSTIVRGECAFVLFRHKFILLWRPLLLFFCYACLAFLYFFWCSCDAHELDTGREWMTRAEQSSKRIWIFADALFLVAVCLGALFWREPFLFHQISLKDFAIFGCLVVYGIVSFLFWFSSRSHYDEIYRCYLTGCRITSEPVLARSALNLAVLASRSHPRVLDFGCANGKRLCEVLPILGVKSSPVTITCFDKLSEWRGEAQRTIEKAGYTCEFVVASSKLAETSHYDAVHLSHMLYDWHTVREIINRLRPCAEAAKKTFIIIRGYSPRSVFGVVSRIQAVSGSIFNVRSLVPAQNHIWNSAYLTNLVEELRLRRVNQLEAVTADFEIQQDYELSGNSLKYLFEFLTYLYGQRWANHTRAFLRDYTATLSANKADSEMLFPNRDLVYLYEAGKLNSDH
jgi:hypothetical protein